MKQLIRFCLVLLGILFFGITNASNNQEYYRAIFISDLERVPVYSQPYAIQLRNSPSSKETPIDYLYFDPDNESSAFEIIVLEDTPLRYLIAYSNIAVVGESSSKAYTKTGWIDKKHVGAWEHPHITEDGRFVIRLYPEPDDNADYIEIPETNERMIVTAFAPNGFCQVLMISDGKYLTGWTRNYCMEFFTTCT